MPTNVEQLSRRIEEVVKEHLAACRREAEAAVGRAFCSGSRRSARAGSSARSPKSESRRNASELAALRARLYEAVLAKPGETMGVFALELGSSARVLQFPMRQLRQTKQVRSAGQRSSTRYFPMVVSKTA
jgi:hypothetical protein